MRDGPISWHALADVEVLERLESQPTGLDEQEAARRLTVVGRNELPVGTAIGPLGTFFRQFTSPLIYLLLSAGFLSLLIGERWDAWFIFGVLTINAVVGTFQELRADASARALRSLVPQSARLRRAGITRDVPAGEIVPGDIAELESGMRVTADMRLLNAQGLQVDESALTGESLPITKKADPVPDPATPVADRTDMAFAGTNIVGGRALGVVVETAARTQLGHIGRTLEDAAYAALETPLVRRMARLARQIAIGAVGLIAFLAIILLTQGDPWRDVALLAIALAVAAIPQGLPIAVTVALAAASRRMARRNVIVRSLPAVEGLGACTLIATDKTGTLTINRLTVQQVVTPQGQAAERAQWLGAPVDAEIRAVGLAAALCNEAKLSDTGSPVGDAVDIALMDFARESAIDLEAVTSAERLAIIPYEPELRFAAVEAEHDGQTRIIVKGAPETVLAMCAGDTAALTEISDRMAADGYRVLLLAEGNGGEAKAHLHDRLSGLRPIGFVGLTDPLRYGVQEAIAECREAGIEVRMVTGDHPATALAIARQLGMEADGNSVLTGAELAVIGDDERALTSRIADATVFARIDPAQKLAIVRHLSGMDHIVAVTGDGVNDGPALRAADIGVAMGLRGTDVARGASDLILADDNFATIVAGVEEGRVTFSNIRKIVLFVLATGIAEIGIFLAALAAGLPMPLTPLQLLWLNLVTNGVQDVTLGFGRGEGDEMQRPPRRTLAALIDRQSLLLMLPGAIFMTFAALWLLDRELAAGASVAEARNAVLLMVVLYQNAFLLGIRQLRAPFWRWHPSENRWLFLGLGVALLLQLGAMHSAVGQNLLGLAPADGELWLVCIAAAVLTLLINEVAKKAARRTELAGQSYGAFRIRGGATGD